MFDRVTIIGVGLIGGSLALALKRAGVAKTIAGCGRSTIGQAQELGIIDEAHTDVAAAVTGADVVVLCTPLSTYCALARQIAPHLKPGAILTDVGSVKMQPSQDILQALMQQQRGLFVPGHPIAGTEKSGPEAAFAELFEGRNVILTPFKDTDKTATARVEQLWLATGAKVERMEAHAHDAMYAHVSHLVQLLCSAYGVMLVRRNTPLPQDETMRRFLRLCGSDPVMWRDIFAANREAVLACLDDFSARWDRLKQMGTEAMAEYVRKTKGKREKLEEPLRPRLRGRQDFLGEPEASLENPEGVSLRPTVNGHPPLPPPQAVGEYALLPIIISATLVDSLEKKEYAHVIGGGFRGFTRNLLAEPIPAITDKGSMDVYGAVLKEFRAAIASSKAEVVEGLLNEGRKAYEACK